MPGALQRSQEREASQQRRIEELERELQTAKAATDARGGNRETSSPDPTRPDQSPAELLNNHVLLSLAEWASVEADGSIPKPKGTITQLQDKMGIPLEQKPCYNAIRYHFSTRLDASGIAWYRYYHQQDHVQVQKFLVLMRHEIPFLRRFAANWASAEIVRTILKNRRDKHHRINLPQDVALQATSFRPRPRKRRAPSPSFSSVPPDNETPSDHEAERQARPQPRPRPRTQQLPDDRAAQGRGSQQGLPARRTRRTDHDSNNGTGNTNKNENANENGGANEDENDEQPRPKRSRRQSTTNATAASRSRAPTTSATKESLAGAKHQSKVVPSRGSSPRFRSLVSSRDLRELVGERERETWYSGSGER